VLRAMTGLKHNNNAPKSKKRKCNYTKLVKQWYFTQCVVCTLSSSYKRALSMVQIFTDRNITFWWHRLHKTTAYQTTFANTELHVCPS